MQMEDIKIIDIKVDDEAVNIGDIKTNVEQIYPELEDLEVIPSAEEQNFKSSKYGYDNVKVKAVEGKELNIVPTTEAQQYEGLYSKVNVNAIESEEITITPTATDQVKEGMYNKVTVAGDSDLIPENIKEGTSIFGVEGTAQTMDFEITTGQYLFYYGNRLDTLYELLALCKNVTNTSQMFYVCSSLKTLDLSSFNMSKATNISSMFGSCSNLTDLNMNNCDMGKASMCSNVLYGCSKLTNLTFGVNYGKGFLSRNQNYSNYTLSLSSCNNLTHESLMSVINNLYDLNLTYDVANGGKLFAQSLVLGSTNKAKLTEEEIAIATNKGWNVS